MTWRELITARLGGFSHSTRTRAEAYAPTHEVTPTEAWARFQLPCNDTPAGALLHNGPRRSISGVELHPAPADLLSLHPSLAGQAAAALWGLNIPSWRIHLHCSDQQAVHQILKQLNSAETAALRTLALQIPELQVAQLHQERKDPGAILQP